MASWKGGRSRSSEVGLTNEPMEESQMSLTALPKVMKKHTIRDEDGAEVAPAGRRAKLERSGEDDIGEDVIGEGVM